MTIGFSKALGPTVRVNCIQAGPFLTDISEASSWTTGAILPVDRGMP